MNIYEQIERLVGQGAFSEAEGLIGGLLARDARDAMALTLLGTLHAVTGRFSDAIGPLEQAAALNPSGFGALFMLAQVLQKLERPEPAAGFFARAAKAVPPGKFQTRAAMGVVRCLVDIGRAPEAITFCIQAGLLPAQAAARDLADPEAFSVADLASLPDAGVSALMYAMYGAGNYAGVGRLGLALADRGDNLRTNAVLAEVWPVSLLRLGRKDEAAAAHLRIVAAGGRATDFRPAWPNAQLARVNPELAADLYRRDLAAFDAASAPEPAAPAPPALQQALARTVPADVTGPDGAVFRAQVASRATGAVYRMEYGPDAATVGAGAGAATPWRDLPAPLGGPARQLAYRAQAWQPQSTQFSWITAGAPGQRAAARLTAPFSTDRNHLSGIGACDLLLGLTRAGGVDLRDAEAVITLRGDGFTHGGACLTLWAARDTADADGGFCSQWALTGDPVPDAALESGAWTRVRLRLSGDPAQWTFVGNNPKEQGPRARRYRPLPIDQTLSRSDHPFVLLFAFGQERTPPGGSIEIFEFEVRHRAASVLAPAAGAIIAQSPPAAAPPEVLTDGSRGCDALLWTSDTAPRYPLQFRWTLPRPVVPASLRIAQHPFYPARDAELWITAEDGSEARLWSGALPEARPDRIGASGIEETLSAGRAAVAVTLRILSGYHPERCGLDSIEITGEGARFTGDGQPCNVSEDVRGLAPGALHYRVVVREGEQVAAGEVLRMVLPATRAPVLESARPLPRAGGGYMVRANAMGLEAELWSELRRADGTVEKGPRISLGSERTARHIIYVPAGLPRAAGSFSLRARNSEGEATLGVPWPPEES